MLRILGRPENLLHQKIFVRLVPTRASSVSRLGVERPSEGWSIGRQRFLIWFRSGRQCVKGKAPARAAISAWHEDVACGLPDKACPLIVSARVFTCTGLAPACSRQASRAGDDSGSRVNT